MRPMRRKRPGPPTITPTRKGRPHMTVICTTPAAPSGSVIQSAALGWLATAKRWWASYLEWRIEQTAIDQLWAMSDRELWDIGLTRGEIFNAVRGEVTHGRPLPGR